MKSTMKSEGVDVAGSEAVLEYERQLAAIESALAKRRLETYRPYPKQKEFHRTYARERLLAAGNQCVSPWTWIEGAAGDDVAAGTPDVVARSADIFASEDARVVALADGVECVAQAHGGFLKGIEPAYRVVMESGRYFDCSASHQVMSEQGWISFSRLVSLSGGLRSSRKSEDYQASCVEDGYLCDPQLLKAEGSGLDALLGQADARRYILSFSHEDAEAQKSRYTNPSQQSDRLSIADDGSHRHAALYGQFAGAFLPQPVLQLRDGILNALRSDSEFCRLQSLSGFDPDQTPDASCETTVLLRAVADRLAQKSAKGQIFQQYLSVQPLGCSSQVLHHGAEYISIFYPCWHPRLVGGSRIIAIVPIGFQPILDVQVPGPNNYKAGGVFHHNCGKTVAGSMEMAMHLTGLYPDWWEGRRFSKAIIAWGGSVTGVGTRDTVQRLVVGRPGQLGTGSIPLKCIVETKTAPGVADALDHVKVKHVTGGVSLLYFKTYEQGREKWQGETLDVVWFDEEPPQDIYMEGLTRTNATGGIAFMTFTPLLGMSNVVRRFLMEKPANTAVITMTIDDVTHFSEEQKASIIASYPEHEREARLRGIPTLGSGKIFPVLESSIKCDAFDIPRHFVQLGGIDFGWDHPTAAVCLAWDRDADVVYVTKTHRMKETTPVMHAAALRPWGEWLPWAWPHDGLQHDKGSGNTLMEIYRAQGLKMMDEMATFEDGGNGVEAGLMMMLDMMHTGRFKVFSHLEDWFEEFRLYHRKEGKIVKEYDDLICATRYAYMMRRYGTTVGGVKNVPLRYKLRRVA